MEKYDNLNDLDCDILDMIINTKLDGLEGEEKKMTMEKVSKAMKLKEEKCNNTEPLNIPLTSPSPTPSATSEPSSSEVETESGEEGTESGADGTESGEVETFSNINTSGNGFKLDINLILKSVFFGAIFYLLSIPEVYKMTKKCCKSVDGVLLHSIVFALVYYVVVHFI